MPFIRSSGTIGWIVGCSIISLSFIGEKTTNPLYLSGMGAIILGLFSLLSLPRTLLSEKVKLCYSDIFFLNVLNFLKNKAFFISFFMFFAISILFMPFYISIQQQLQSMNIAPIGAVKSLASGIRDIVYVNRTCTIIEIKRLKN